MVRVKSQELRGKRNKNAGFCRFFVICYLIFEYIFPLPAPPASPRAGGRAS